MQSRVDLLCFRVHTLLSRSLWSLKPQVMSDSHSSKAHTLGRMPVIRAATLDWEFSIKILHSAAIECRHRALKKWLRYAVLEPHMLLSAGALRSLVGPRKRRTTLSREKLLAAPVEAVPWPLSLQSLKCLGEFS